jgi:lipase chaperone LimK
MSELKPSGVVHKEYHVAVVDLLEKRIAARDIELDRRRNLLEDVINALDLSDETIDKHGPMGAEPSVLVTLVIDNKDRRIAELDKVVFTLSDRLDHYLEQITDLGAQLSKVVVPKITYFGLDIIPKCECGTGVSPNYSIYCHKCGARLDWAEVTK